MIGALFTASRFGLAAVAGIDAFAEATLRFGFKLAVKSFAANRAAGEEMVELMRSRVPVDSGRLLNGIELREEDETIVVEASAIRGEFDYARAVEFGHDVGHPDPLGPPRARRSRAQHGSHADAEPFFVDSAAEVLERRGLGLEDAASSAAEESGL